MIYNAYVIFAIFFSIATYLPLTGIKHWVAKVWDFLRIQVLVFQLVFLFIGFFFYEQNFLLILFVQAFLLFSILFQFRIIYPYLVFNKSKKQKPKIPKEAISLISVNVLQYNTEYHKLIELITKEKPNILLTMETNKDWENALEEVTRNYSYAYAIPKENRYGMHFYTNLKVKHAETHYFLTENRPTVQVSMLNELNQEFMFFGTHPAPESPTEKATSKQKEAELMMLAKLIRKLKIPSVVAGDFNNVCWSQSSKLFAKVANLEDARLGRGIFGTFPVWTKFFRFPIDLLYHSKEVTFYDINVLPEIGSDHLPIFCKFNVAQSKSYTNEKLDEVEKEEIKQTIIEGKLAKRNDE